jgi:catechol 2,3-dioxygenase-like lactoylglutathione lyase family enzyme
MTIQRTDNVGIVVDDLDAAVAFFTELGMELEGRTPIEGSWAGNVVGLGDMRSEIAMMRIPDAPGRLELAQYHTPKAITPKPEITPANTLGLHRVMFAVDDIEDTLARLRPHGAELVGELTRYEDSYLLCYLRGPRVIVTRWSLIRVAAGSGVLRVVLGSDKDEPVRLLVANCEHALIRLRRY